MALTQLEINKCVLKLKQQSKRVYYNAGLSKHQVVDILNALNDDYESRRGAVRALMNTAAGATLTTNLLRSIKKSWLTMKWGNE